MKRCPTCTTIFVKAGKFCLQDGALLEDFEPDATSAHEVGAHEVSAHEVSAHEVSAHEVSAEDNTAQMPALPIPSEPEPPLPDEDGTARLPADEEALIGQTLADRYSIEALVGRGGMGPIYRARHLMLDRTVAVKFLHRQFVADERLIGRFMREARAMARIEHPNAAAIYDFGVLPSGGAYLVMEYVEGHSLRAALEQAGKLPIADALAIADQVCRAVDAGHKQGIVHRDLKPENILLKQTGDGVRVKVVDFGLAEMVAASVADDVHEIAAGGGFFGTPAYLAPEFYSGEEITERADIYALGIILYEMLVGEPPFRGSVQEIIAGHLFAEAPAPSASVTGLPPAVDAAIRLAVRKAPGERPASAAELAAWLRTALPIPRAGAVPPAFVPTFVFSPTTGNSEDPPPSTFAAERESTLSPAQRTMMEAGELVALVRAAADSPSVERTTGASAPWLKRRMAAGVATIIAGILLLGFVDGGSNPADTSNVMSATPPPFGESLPAGEVDAAEPPPIPAPPAAKEGADAAPRPAPDDDPAPTSAKPSRRPAPRRQVVASSQITPATPRQADRPRPVEPKKEKKRRWYDPRKWF